MNRCHQGTTITFLTSVLFLSYFRLWPQRLSCRWSAHIEHEKTVPPFVHFIIGQADRKNVTQRFQPTSSFSFVNYLVVLAARRHLRPSKLFVHYFEEPKTFWWNRTKHDPEIRLTMVPTRFVEQIFNQSIVHHTHRSDVLRLEILLAYGGVYLDIDVLTLRSFEPLLQLGDAVMAFEDGSRRLIGSAVIIARRKAVFLQRIYDAYQHYDRNCYRCNSIEIPAKLAAIYPREVTLLPAGSFYLLGWRQSTVLFKMSEYNFTASFAIHLWNSFNSHRLSRLSPNQVLTSSSTLARMFRQVIGRETIDRLRRTS